MVDCQELYTWVDSGTYEWIDDYYPEFGECSGESSGSVLYQVWQDQAYAYAVTSSGLDIFDIISTNKVSSITYRDGFSTIWGNDSTIYLGTLDDGIKYIEKATFSPGDLGANLKNYDYYYNTSSSEINYLHGANNTLAVVTPSGIDVLNNGPNGYKSTTDNANVTKCFLTSKNELYYIVQETGDFDGVFKMNSVLCDWSAPDVSYVQGVSFIPAEAGVTDIFITENTSEVPSANTLFLATTKGAFILDEGTKEFDNYTI